MSNYFSKYPKIIYKNQVVTNILTRAKLQFSESTVFYPYIVKEGDTPEILAYNMFGDPEKHWIILAINDFLDPQFSFPLTHSQFNLYIENKYKSLGAEIGVSGIVYAQQTDNPEPFRYRIIQSTQDLRYNDFPIEEKYFVDEATFFNTIPSSKLVFNGQILFKEDKEILNIYDYENELNEKNREIKMVRRDVANMIYKEFQSVMGK